MNYHFNWNIIQECKVANRNPVDRKKYQHDYYLRVTKPKRHQAKLDVAD